MYVILIESAINSTTYACSTDLLFTRLNNIYSLYSSRVLLSYASYLRITFTSVRNSVDFDNDNYIDGIIVYRYVPSYTHENNK